jgi:hypothetical protein
MLLTIALGAALLGGAASSAWYLLRLWQALPRRNADLVLF